jgi:hypothetical protein
MTTARLAAVALAPDKLGGKRPRISSMIAVAFALVQVVGAVLTFKDSF